MTAFKKGQEVTIIRKWSRDCTTYAQKAIVYSCGKKQMILTCAITGEELGRNFLPKAEQYSEGVVILGHDDATIERESLTLSARIIDSEIKRYEHIMSTEYWANEASQSYKAAITKDYNEAKTFTPKFIVRQGR